MKRGKFEYCDKTKKYIYSSEAKAIRAVTRYDEIKRVYFCSHCEGFHTTSKSIDEVLALGELPVEEENELLRERINELVEETGTWKKKYYALRQKNKE